MVAARARPWGLRPQTPALLGDPSSSGPPVALHAGPGRSWACCLPCRAFRGCQRKIGGGGERFARSCGPYPSILQFRPPHIGLRERRDRDGARVSARSTRWRLGGRCRCVPPLGGWSARFAGWCCLDRRSCSCGPSVRLQGVCRGRNCKIDGSRREVLAVARDAAVTGAVSGDPNRSRVGPRSCRG